jgi:hypothetical protein
MDTQLYLIVLTRKNFNAGKQRYHRTYKDLYDIGALIAN